MSALHDLRIGKPDVLRIRDIVTPYLEPVQEFLPVSGQGGRGEREQDAPVHVHEFLQPAQTGVGDDDDSAH